MRYDRAHLVPAPATFAPFLLEGGLGRPLRLPREVPIGSPYFGGSTEEIAFNTRQSYDVGNVLGADVTVNNSTQYLISRAKLLTGLLDATEDEVQGLFNSASNVSMRDLTNRLDVTTAYNAGFARNFLKLGYDYIDRTNRPRIGGESLGNVDVRTGLPYFPLRFAYSPDLREDSSTIQGISFIDKLDTLDDRLHIMGSYRYDWQATNSVTRTPLETNRASGRNEGESWVAGAAFDVTPWMTVYGNRSVGFVPSVLGTVAGALPAPEGRDLAEVGARYFLFDKRLSLTTSLFDLARTNVTIPDPRDPTGQTRILVGGLRSRGTEFELQGEILPGLNVIASLAIQNIAVTDRATEEGGEFFGVPKKTASLWVTYAPQSTPFAGLTFGVGARGNSRSTTGIGTDSVYVPGYVVADAMVAYQRDDFSVSLNVKNIINEYSLNPSYFNYYIGINQGRSALLQADYRF
ncbi:hypothetical protein ASF59_00575 [Methylobacterium sp. Leaf121]|nr:hypothetical protein ASF59_00575 [Methylobacterium sp. Leaf121]